MAGDITANSSVHIMRETGGYAVIPDATGAAGLYLPINRGALPESQLARIQRTTASGRNKRTKHKMGAAAGALSLGVDLYGFAATEVTPGNSPPTEDALDVILRSLLGSPAEHDAAQATAATANSISHAGAQAVNDLIAVRGNGTNNGAAQWARVSNAASPFSVAPNWSDTPSAGDIIAAGRTWSPKLGNGQDVHALGGDSFTTIIDVDGRHYFLPGCRPSAFSIVQAAGQAAEISMSLMADSRLRQQAANLPAVDVDALDVCVGLLAPVIVNGTEYPEIAEVRVDLQPQVVPVTAAGLANGRSNYKVVGFSPAITINPLNATVWEDLYDNATDFNVLVKFGIGELANGRWTTLSYYMEHAQVTAVPGMQDDNGYLRQSVQIEPLDAGDGTGVDAPLFLMGRC